MAPYPTHSAEERILGPLCYRTAQVRKNQVNQLSMSKNVLELAAFMQPLHYITRSVIARIDSVLKVAHLEATVSQPTPNSNWG